MAKLVPHLPGLTDLAWLKALIDDREAYAEYAAGLQRQIDKLNEKIAVYGQAEQIPGLLAQAKADAATAQKILDEAREKAKKIVGDAEAGLREREAFLKDSEEALAEDRATLARERSKLNEERRAFDNRVKVRDDELHQFANTLQQRAAQIDLEKADLERRAAAFEEAARAARG